MDKHIPQGYKDSPLGIIPKEWEVKRLGDLGSFKNGLNFSPNDSGISYYFLGVGDFLNRNVIDVRNLGHIHLKDKLDESYLIKDQDLVFVRSNGSKSLVGRSVLIKSNQEEATYSGFCIRFRSDNKCTTTKYIQHLINVGYLKRFLVYEGRGTNITNLNQDILGRLSFPIPPIAEQDRVLHILSIWDTAIEKQSELIEKLKLRKRALMQQLLTGKKRLPGFSGEWKEVKLGDIGEMFKGCGVPKDSIIEAGHKCLTYGDIYTKYDYVISNVKSYINDDIASKSTKIQYGDICFAGSGETKEDIGKCAAFIDAQYGYAGGDIIIFRAKNSNPITLSYILNSDSVIRQKSNMGQGHSVVHIYPYQLEKLRFKLPPKVEQDTIASILMDADKEIEFAKEQLVCLQSQKRGLMQQLLTGKKRVIE